MGHWSERAIEIAEIEAEQKKDEWIKKKLNNYEADENTEGWSEAEDEYEEMLKEEQYRIEAGWDDDDFYKDNWFVDGKTKHSIFVESMESCKEIMKFNSNRDYFNNLSIMLYGHIVASVEGYLSSTFIDNVVQDDDLIRKLVETDSEFKTHTFTIAEIYSKKEALSHDIAKYLKDLIFHKLDKIKPMYKSVLDIEFGDIGWLFKAVLKRHDCVHRAGYDKSGNIVSISQQEILDLIENASNLIDDIEKNLPSNADREWIDSL